MKIGTPDEDFIELEQVKKDLQHFLAQDEPWQSPPCPNCNNHQPKTCSPNCTEAPRALSIDPDRFPIEQNAVALVYELNANRVFQTCWSCEGHVREGESKIWKLPQVCFYSQSAIYPKLISSHLSNLFIQKRLKYNWHLSLTEISQSIHPTYSIRPELTHETELNLGLLQNDLKEISKDLHLRLKFEADKLLKKLS